MASGPRVRAVGWLHPDEGFPTGECSRDRLERIQQFAQLASHWAEALGWPASAGVHCCEFCGEAAASGNFGVLSNERIYVAPELLAHYVERHAYLPPAEFLEALDRCPLPGTIDYASLSVAFRSR